MKPSLRLSTQWIPWRCEIHLLRQIDEQSGAVVEETAGEVFPRRQLPTLQGLRRRGAPGRVEVGGRRVTRASGGSQSIGKAAHQSTAALRILRPHAELERIFIKT